MTLEVPAIMSSFQAGIKRTRGKTLFPEVSYMSVLLCLRMWLGNIVLQLGTLPNVLLLSMKVRKVTSICAPGILFHVFIVG